jgi:phosphoglycolate phosphatase-like HAD superfamily hydrolase
MFDLDGTLTETVQADEECFVSALLDVFGFENVNRDWSAYRHTTDSGILVELFEARRNRVPQPAEIKHFQNRFVTLLNEASQNLRRFEPVPGTEVLLEDLAGREHFGVALATGGWKISAQWKLKKTGLDFLFGASAFADDECSREGIMGCALQRALRHYRQTRFDAVIYIGDGVWDIRASKKLGYHFVGIGRGISAERLYSAGATTVFSDYSNVKSFISVLESIAGQPETCLQKL